MGYWLPPFKVITTMSSRFPNNFFTEMERQECDVKKAIGNHLTAYP